MRHTCANSSTDSSADIGTDWCTNSITDAYSKFQAHVRTHDCADGITDRCADTWTELHAHRRTYGSADIYADGCTDGIAHCRSNACDMQRRSAHGRHRD